MDRLHNINKTSSAKSFDTYSSYDFATLYTNIPHDALKNNMRKLVHETYKVRGAKYLIVDTHGKAHWSESPSSVTACVNIDKNERMEYLADGW